MTGIRLLLASASPRRADLLRELGIPFEVRSSNAPESVRPGESPEASARRLALEKATAVVNAMNLTSRTSAPPYLVLGADTIVADGPRIFGKPRDEADASSMLRRLRGRAHQVVTGVALVDARDGTSDVRSETSRVRLRTMSNDEIDRYVASGDPLDKAGAYAIQNRAFHPVEAIEGCYSNVVGLPLCLVVEMLTARGVKVQMPSTRGKDGCDCVRISSTET